MRRGIITTACTLVLATTGGGVAWASFPWPTPAPGQENNYSTFHTAAGQVPNDLNGENTWKFAATPGDSVDEPWIDDGAPGTVARGASVVDALVTADTAWRTTTGRPDVSIAVLDSGIKWNGGEMGELRFKTRLSRGELPRPNKLGTTLEGAPCAGYDTGQYDANHDGVFNVKDYLCDSRVSLAPPRGVGPADKLDPQDLIIAFTDGQDDDGNGFKDDIAGWDFLDDDNDPYDDVQYGHGTGEAQGSSAEVNDGGGDQGSCPNCMFVPTRVGDSFVADANDFAQATIYAVDNGVSVVQEALGTLNNTSLARDAIQYAYDHGVTVIASAADEAAQHHNFVSSLPHVIVVNSVRQYKTESPSPMSYVQFNGCTNFSSKVTLSIPSTSCSSDATGVGSGLAGLVYSAALNAREAGKIDPHPGCRRTDGSACVITANEVRQIMATGVIGGRQLSDDVSFTNPDPEPGCSPAPTPGCTDPNLALQTLVTAKRPVLAAVPTTRSYPARDGHDQFYGFGRVNTNRSVKEIALGHLPPAVEITSPEWFSQANPEATSFSVSGQIDARGKPYTCRVLVAPGSYPNNNDDFKPLDSTVCNGTTSRTAALDGVLGSIAMNQLRALFPQPDAGNFRGRESGGGAGQTANGRPNSEPYGFVVRVEATTAGPPAMVGHDRRNLYLHRDQDMLPGFPREMSSDGASSPLFVDLDGDNRNELVFGTSDGVVHAQNRAGDELPGWPVHGDALPLHTGARAFTSGEVAPKDGSFLASLAAADIDRDGVPEVVGADYEGKVYVWNTAGARVWQRGTDLAFSGKPLRPFENVRRGRRYRTQRGFIGSPVLADLDRNDGGRLEVIAAAMDRHVYAWNDDGSAVPGYPVLVIDRTKITAIDPETHAPTFKNIPGDQLNQGAIVHTPAVADLTGDGKPEIVVGSNEEYEVDETDPPEGPFNAANFSVGPLSPVFAAAGLELADTNGRIFVVKNAGDPGEPTLHNDEVFLGGWPVPIGRLMRELLPVVGEGITGSPVVGPATMNCPAGGAQTGPKVGVIPDGGPGYVLNADGSSCYGETGGRYNVLESDVAANDTNDRPVIPAVGHPAFGSFAAAPGQVSFLSPATGVLRAADLAIDEYQYGGQDFLMAWDPLTGQARPGLPGRMNDLQFLTGPSSADIDGDLAGREELLGSSAYLDLQAFNDSGHPVGTNWPKLTSDWTVANPLIGSWDTSDTDADARKVVVTMTRSGFFFAYSTPAPACSSGSWPRFHHDNANSGYFDRDAVSPGKPTALTATATSLKFKAPGDDLLCGDVAKYEVVSSASPITAANFAAAEAVKSQDGFAPAGADEEIPVGATQRYVAVRAVDEQGNVGRPAVVDRTGEPPATGGGAGGGAGTGGGAGAGGGAGTGGTPGAGVEPCVDRSAPQTRLVRLRSRASRRGILLRGRALDRGCGRNGIGRLRVVQVALARVAGVRCRFLGRTGFFSRVRSCGRRLHLNTATINRPGGLADWTLRRPTRLLPGRYRLYIRGVDMRGNVQRRATAVAFVVR